MTKNGIAALISAGAIFFCGLAAVNYANTAAVKEFSQPEINVVDLYEDPDDYTLSDDKDAADVIIEENLDKTQAANNVAAVVFDFRGFDTLGESFILLTAIAGTFVILSRKKAEHAGGKGGDEA